MYKKRAIPEALNILSLGVGIQSTTLYYMSALGEIPRYDYAIFADPGREKPKTYEYLKYLQYWQKEHSAPEIIVCGKKSIYKDLINALDFNGSKFASIPAFTPGTYERKAMLKRQCTDFYKIREVIKAIRKLYGVTGHQWTPPTNISIGITTDEAGRMQIPDKKWKTHCYPFCGYNTSIAGHHKIEGSRRFSVTDCIAWLVTHGFPTPPRSSCTFCPYQSDQSWLETKTKDPDEFNDLVYLDQAIRDSSAQGIERPLFLHPSLKPLSEVNFESKGIDLFNSCDSGLCGL